MIRKRSPFHDKRSYADVVRQSPGTAAVGGSASFRKPPHMGVKGSADTTLVRVDIKADNEHVVSKPRYTEQPSANPPIAKGHSKVRVGKSKSAAAKLVAEIRDEDRLTGITIEDSGIQNMNYLIINGLEDLSAEDIWAVGKTLGVESFRDESEVIKHIKGNGRKGSSGVGTCNIQAK
ncbi:hypothetical protein Ancab_016395 [Ancistrocladus abbreviatus]